MSSFDPKDVVDVLIIGGSYAGLAVAHTLYRVLHRCIILDSGKSRYSPGTPIRAVPTSNYQDPSQWIASARKELQECGLVRFETAEVRSIDKDETRDLFVAVDGLGQKFWGRRVCLAIGMVEELPSDIDGYAALYPQRILPCMFTFGYEKRDSNAAGLLATSILANPKLALILAEDILKICKELTIYTNGNLQLKEALQKMSLGAGVLVDERVIRQLIPHKSDAVEIHFADNTVQQQDFLVHKPSLVLDQAPLKSLNLQTGPFNEIVTQGLFGETAIPGVFAAGDCATMARNIPCAVASGTMTATGISRSLPRRT